MQPARLEVNEALPQPFVDASPEAVEACTTESDYTRLAHGLYREAGAIISLCSCACSAEGYLQRNQAICAGLLVRITKFMVAVAQLSTEVDRREVVMALSRCIAESATNLRFLILKNDNALYDAFVKTALGPERELFDKVTTNIKARGGKTLPIEKRMLESIQSLCKTSGLKIEEIPSGVREWGGTMRQRIEALGLPEHAYVSIQRFHSHAVHGTWVDLAIHHLVEHEEPDSQIRFEPKTSSADVDERLFGPIALYSLDAAEGYLKHFFAGYEGVKAFFDRIQDLRTRIMRVMDADEKNVQRRRGQSPDKTPDASGPALG